MSDKKTRTCTFALLELLFHSSKLIFELANIIIYLGVIFWSGCLHIVCHGDGDCDYMFDARLESLSPRSSDHHQSSSCQTIINCPNLRAAALQASDWMILIQGSLWLVNVVTAGTPGTDSVI